MSSFAARTWSGVTISVFFVIPLAPSIVATARSCVVGVGDLVVLASLGILIVLRHSLLEQRLGHRLDEVEVLVLEEFRPLERVKRGDPDSGTSLLTAYGQFRSPPHQTHRLLATTPPVKLERSPAVATNAEPRSGEGQNGSYSGSGHCDVGLHGHDMTL
jgi:hypothetical protein